MIADTPMYGKLCSSVVAYLGLHKDINICQAGKCTKFKPGQADHCPIAQESFLLSKQVGLVLVMACEDYQAPKKENDNASS